MSTPLLAVLLPLLGCSGSGTPAPATPTANAPLAGQDAVLNIICGRQTVDVSVNRCGNFYSTYPTGFIADAATEIFNLDGQPIDSCGGYRAFVSEAERACASYLRDCTPVVQSCTSRR